MATKGGRQEGSGRKPYQIDWKLVDHYLTCGCTGTQVAARIGIHPDTLYGRVTDKFKVGFSEYMREKKENGRSLLKEAQFDEAVRKRNPTLLVWLGKQILEQSDKQENRHTGSIPLAIVNYSDKDIEPWKDKTKEKDDGDTNKSDS